MSDELDVDVPDLDSEEIVDPVDPPDEEIIDPVDPPSDDDDKPLSSSQARFQKLANERREKELEAQTAREQAEFYKRQLEQMQAQNRQPVVEELDPQERNMRAMQADQQRINFQMWDLNDRNEFLNKANKSDALNRYVDKVETKLTQLRSQGVNASRIQLAKEMLADDVIAKQSQVPKIKREAAAKVQAARGEPLKVKSDVGRTKVEEGLEDRLRNTFI
jgi:hypothetical protein